MERSRKRRRSVLTATALAFLSLVWGTQYLVIRIGQETVPPLLGVFFRFLILAIVAQAAVFATGVVEIRTQWRERFVFGASQALAFGCLYWGQKHLPSAVTALLFLTAPLFVAPLAHFFVTGERLTIGNLLPVGLGFAGAALLISPAGMAMGHVASHAALVVLAGALFSAMNKVFSKRLVSVVPPLILIRDLGAVVAFLSGIGWLAFEGTLSVVLTSKAIASFLYLGCVASGLANIVSLRLLRRYRVTAMSYLQFVTALVAVLCGVLLGREAVSAQTLIGFLLVLFGLMSLGRTRTVNETG